MAKRTRKATTRSDPFASCRARLKKLRAELRAIEADSILITNATDIHYLTSFPGEDAAAIITARRVIILSDTRFAEELESIKPLASIKLRSGSMIDLIQSLASDLGLKRLAIQAEHMTVMARADLAKRIGAKKVLNSTGLLDGLRLIKDDAEVRLVRRAAKIQQDALLATRATLRPGQKETEIAARLEFKMRTRGADGPSFDTIAAARANGSLPHATPGTTTTAANKPLLIDWGARYGGYCADMTRVFSFGRWPRKVAEIYGIVLEAFHAAADAAGPGVRCVDVDRAARDVIRRAGYGKQFGHGLGHGIGLDIHEDPRMSPNSTHTLRAGMIFTIEPGIYLPGIGGVRLEDDFLVTDRGVNNLCSLPKDIDWATI